MLFCIIWGQSLISVYLDFSKAFNTIDHGIMCGKLERYGVRGFMNTWFRSYLGGRSQYVDINGSSCTKINCSVPQDSILDPFRFLLYINDFNRCSDLSFLHYADDSTVFTRGHSLRDLCNYANEKLYKVVT